MIAGSLEIGRDGHKVSISSLHYLLISPLSSGHWPVKVNRVHPPFYLQIFLYKLSAFDSGTMKSHSVGKLEEEIE